MTDTTEQQRELPIQERRPMLQASLVTSVMAVLAVLPMNAAFYDVLRIAIVTWAVLTVVHVFRSAGPSDGLQSLRVWPFLLTAVAAAVVWWPYSFTFDKSIWVVFDLVFAVAAAVVGWRLERTHAWQKRRWSALAVTLLVLVVTVAGMVWLMSERASSDADRQWCSQQDAETQAFHPRCGGGVDDDGSVPGSDHNPG